MNNYYAPHGEFKLYVSNNILIARLIGSWNQECAESFAQAFKARVEPLKNQEWAHLVFLDDWEISVPEIVPIVTDLATFCIMNGLKKSAQVASESMMKKMYLEKMAVENDDTFERQIFSDKEQAISWLRKHNFTVDDDVVAHEVV